MKKYWKSLNNLLVNIFFCSVIIAQSAIAETKDIWQQSKSIKPSENKNLEIENKNELPPINLNQSNKVELQISSVSQSALDNQNKEVVFGIYDPKLTNINIDFWKSIPSEVFNNFSSEIFKNEYSVSTSKLINRIFFTKTNLSHLDDKGLAYLNFVSTYLAKTKDSKLIDSVIDQNNLLLNNEKLLDFLVNNYFSSYQIDKACKYAVNMGAEIKNFELQKFKIFCLVKNKENKKALANLELMRESGFKDDFFIQKINYLLGMLLARQGEENTDTLINIHLSSLANPDFNPSFAVFKNDASKTKYFFNSPFLSKSPIFNSKQDSLTDDDFELIRFLEEGSNIESFPLEKLYALYKKIVFKIDDLLVPNEAFAKYHPVKGRALLYQSILLTRDQQQRLKLIELIKDNYNKNNLAKLGNKVYFSFISSIDKKYLSNEVIQKIFENSQNSKPNNTKVLNNVKYFHQSDVVTLLFDKKINQNQKKNLEQFASLLDSKKYQATEKDIVLATLLAEQKTNLPSGLKKIINTDEIYIPNKIYDMIERKEYSKATLELVLLTQKLQDSKDYARDFLIIVKILDRLNFSLMKQEFINSEFIS